MNRIGFVLLASACATDPETVASTEQAVSNLQTRRDTCVAGDECTFQLSPAATHTCVLAGVKGALGEGTAASPVGATISPTNELVMSNQGSYSTMMVWTVCFEQPVRQHAAWQSGNVATVIAADAYAGERCFLSGITNASPSAFQGLESFASVYRTYGAHELFGNFPTGSDVTLTATCAEIDLLSWHSKTNTTTGPSLTTHLRADDGLTACALAGLGGSIDGYPRGAAVYKENGRWYANQSLGTKLEALCFH